MAQMQAQQPPPDSSVQVAQIKSQDMQAKLKADADHAAADYAFQKWAKEQDINLEYDQLSAQQKADFDNHKVDMAQTSIKLNTQIALSEAALAHQRDTTIGNHMVNLHKSKQALTPPTEPAGKAPQGQAFSA